MSVLSVILLIIIIVIIFFVIIMAIDTHRLVVRDYEVTQPEISKDIRIVLISDLHSKSFGKNNSKLISRISDINPDIILVAGDMYTALKKDVAFEARYLLKELSKTAPIYYAKGNHEQKTAMLADEFEIDYDEYIEELKAEGIVHLDNESISLDEYGIKIYGLTLPFEYYRKMSRKRPSVSEIESLIGKPDADKINVLIAHNPQYFDEYAAWGADLTVSGHVHGGLMRIGRAGVISPNFTLFPKYSGGMYAYKDTGKTLILSCGLGTHHLPIRIFNPGEISHIKIKKTTT